jgi:PAS domain S-box-containing protein
VNKVSCQALGLPLRIARLAGFDLESMLDGLDAKARSEDPAEFLPWDDFATLWDRVAARVPGDAALIDLARRATEATSTTGLGAAFKAERLSPRQVYELLMKFTGPRLFQPVHFRGEERPDGALELEVVIDASLAPCRAWLLGFEGALGPLPMLVGLPASSVERVLLEPRRAVWRLMPADSTGFGASTGPLISELIEQQARLTKVFDELRHRERDFSRMLEALPVLVAVHDHGRIIYVNGAFARFFGERAGQLEGRTLQSLFPQEERFHLETALEERISGWRKLAVEVGGERRVLRMRAGGRHFFRGKPAALWVAGDATREEAARERAAQSEDTLGSVLEAFPDLVMRFDRERRLVSVHGGGSVTERPALERMLGSTFLDIHRAWGRESWPDLRALRDLLDDALEHGTSSQYSYVSPDTVSGKPRDFMVRIESLEGEALLVARDRTRELEDERRLQVVERMASLGELAAGVSHEINNPLTSVLSNLSVLKKRLAKRPSPRIAALLGELEEGTRQIRLTSGRLREFSAARPREQGVVRLVELVERAARLCRTELRDRARLDLDVDASLEVWGDATELEEVVVNLLSNAVQALPENSTADTHHVWVKGRREHRTAVLEVSDDGQGIAASHLQRIFDPFFTTRPRRNGTGLGLAVSHRIVTAHGGAIEAVSRPGHTTLTVRLPVVTTTVAPVPSPSPSRRARVLVVDDEPSIGRSIQRALTQHEVSVVGDGRAAFTQLREGELPDLVLCDLHMPGYTGMELYAALRATRPELLGRLAFMSGGTFTPLAAEFLKDHPVSVLNKPFSPEQLDALVQQVLATGSTDGFTA